MSIILAVLVGAIVGAIVWLIMSLVPFLKEYASIGGVIAFLLVVAERLGAFNV